MEEYYADSSRLIVSYIDADLVTTVNMVTCQTFFLVFV